MSDAVDNDALKKEKQELLSGIKERESIRNFGNVYKDTQAIKRIGEIDKLLKGNFSVDSAAEQA